MEKLKKKRTIVSIAFAIFFMCVGIYYQLSFIKVSGIVLLTLLSGLIEIQVSDKYVHKLEILIMLIAPFILIVFTQSVLNYNITLIKPLSLLCGYFLFAFLFCMFNTMINNIKMTFSITGCIVMFITSINFFVYHFRSRDFGFFDIFSITTAANVSNEYTLIPSSSFLYAWMIFIVFALSIYMFSYKNIYIKRIKSFVLCVICFLVFACIGLDIHIYNYGNGGSVYNGYILNFTLQLKQCFVSTPKGYSSDLIKDYETQYSSSVDSSKDKPDIIVIMNESLADLNVLGELKTNKEVTPFMNSIKENTIKGYALSSIFGGNTANSEYEFLTGNSLAFLPHGSVVYQQFIKKPSYSIVSHLDNYGYHSIAAHPFYASGWQRPEVYEYFGFDETYFLDDYPKENLLRSYVSDREMYEELIKHYHKSKQENDHVFYFGVTMQNHGGYRYSKEDFTNTIELEGYSQEYNDVSQYLSLIHESDQAYQYLIEYFSNVDDPVMILMFGDHHPNLNSSFFEELHNGEFDSLEKQMKQYKVPFILWTNYDIEEEYVEHTSLNYLSNYIYKTANISLPSYNQALNEFNEVIPSLNPLGYYSSSKKQYLTYKEAQGIEKEILDKYSYLQYNSLFDKKYRSEIFFKEPK